MESFRASSAWIRHRFGGDTLLSDKLFEFVLELRKIQLKSDIFPRLLLVCDAVFLRWVPLSPKSKKREIRVVMWSNWNSIRNRRGIDTSHDQALRSEIARLAS